MAADTKSFSAQPSNQPGRADSQVRRRRDQSESPTPATASQPAAPAFAASQLPTHDEIAREAFAIYESEGRPQGRAAEHWRRAEQQLLEQFSHKPPTPTFASARHPELTGGTGSSAGRPTERPSGSWPLSAAYER